MIGKTNARTEAELVFIVRCVVLLIASVLFITAQSGCKSGRIVPVLPADGTEGERCRADSSCNPGLLCNVTSKVCGPASSAPADGTEGGQCRADGSCNPGLQCNVTSKVCGPASSAPADGTEGGRCRADGSCNPGLQCNVTSKVCGLASSAAAATVAIAGDIAQAGRTSYARDNAALITSYPQLVDAVFLLGDNARYDGSGDLLSYFNEYYAPITEANWGQFDHIAYPLPGNHEYEETDAQGYFDYFAERMSAISVLSSYHGFINVIGKGYYSFDINGWHFVGLNSECSSVEGGCDQGSEQETWLKNDLAAHAEMPIIAGWHIPRYACGGEHGDDSEMQAFWADLFDVGADFVFVGHNHYYQRWKPLNKDDPKAAVDLPNGLTQIVTGSTGVDTYSVCSSIDKRVANQVGDDASMGVFFLTVKSDGTYAFEYRLRNGSLFDSGAGASHHAH